MSVLGVEMADADDSESESWLESATRYAELAAHQIARLRNPWWNPAWRDLVADALPPYRAFAVRWGSRRKRSRASAVAVAGRLGLAKGDSAAAVACSPATPFDFGSGSGSRSRSGSGASTSGGDEGSSSQEAAAAAAAGERRRVSYDADVSGAGGACETTVVGIGVSAKDIRRSGKRKTLCELQEEEKLLMQEKNMLQKEMELRKKAYESLRSENKRLKSQQISFKSGRAPIKFATACASSPAPTSRAPFVLPDLNEPPSENLD